MKDDPVFTLNEQDRRLLLVGKRNRQLYYSLNPKLLVDPPTIARLAMSDERGEACRPNRGW